MSDRNSGRASQDPRARRPVPDPDRSSAPFWEAAARHELVVQRCGSCGAWRHPPRPMCPRCRSLDHSFEPVSGTARVWSWIVAHPPLLPAFAERAPYNVVVVELPEGVRMVGNLIGVPNEEIADGMDVVADFEDVAEGVTLPVWRRA